MKRILPVFVFVLLLLGTGFFINFDSELERPDFTEVEENGEKAPDDWLYNQRAYPHNHIDIKAYRAGVAQRKQAANVMQRSGDWELVGPINTGGRITDIELHPTNTDIFYASAAAGGIFKTEDGGSSWEPIFDDANSLSIGNMALAPSDPNIMYVGTGEANGSATSGAFFGDGVYKTTDGGENWTNIGLENSQHIGRIAIDPENADRVYVAAAGLLYGKSEDKGLYRTLDGGSTWDKVLFISDSTSCIDVAINPTNADIIYAATWERTRFPWGRIYGGPTSGIYRSTDGGDTWTKLENGLPQSNSETGRIGIYVAPSNPDVVYASYTTNRITNEFQALYKSTNGGDSWFMVNDDITDVNATFGWFFGNVRVHPLDEDDVFVLGQIMYRSNNGGNSFNQIAESVHVDFHALEVHPLNPNLVVLGCDGGVYISNTGGSSWMFVNKLPVTQFYTCELDESFPNRYYGGTQDNGTNRTLSGNTNDWTRIFGGDGFYVNVDPIDNDFVYCEFQWGSLFRSTDGGFNFEWAQDGILGSDRTNWNTPVVLDPVDPTRLYYGSNRLYISVNRAQSWSSMSGDLTDGEHPSGSQSFGTITTIAPSASQSETVYVGTDDGNVQVTFDLGLNWNNISAGLPDRYVTRVAVDPEDHLTAYVTLSGYRFVDYIPHIMRTTDGGQNWEDISGNLPEIPINDVIVDPEMDQTLYIANDLGVWVTFDLGENWAPLGGNMPLVVVNDLRLHNPTRQLLAGTFGRSMYIFDLTDVTPIDNSVAKENGSLKVFPNPVKNTAQIQFETASTSEASIELFDLQGRKIADIAQQMYNVGQQTIEWNASSLDAGTYIVRVSTKETILTQKVMVVN